MDLNQYLDVFIEESKEHLQACNDKLLELEKNPEELTIVNEIFRAAHTLKGMSATMGYEDLASLTHQMENVLDAIRNEQLKVTPALFDIVFSAVDHLEEMITSISQGGDGKKDVTAVVQSLKTIELGEVQENQNINLPQLLNDDDYLSYDEYELTILEQSIQQGYTPYQVKVTIRKDCLLKAARVFMVFEVFEKLGEVIKSSPTIEMLEEEKFDQTFTITLLSTVDEAEIERNIINVSEIENVIAKPLSVEMINNLSAGQLLQEEIIPKSNLDETSKAVGKQEIITAAKQTSATNAPSQAKTIRVNIDRLDHLMNLFEELVIDRGRLEQISKNLSNNDLQETVERISRTSNDLQTIILNMRMVTIDSVFNRFPRMIRQLARDLDKEIDLEIIGAETELDRTVIDEIGDPLVHLIRNAIDHGIETPDVRIANGKSEKGNITLRAYHSGNHVFIEIEDNGSGISRDKVLKKAIERKIVTEQIGETLSDQEVYELIFSSGFSTADKISDISGRGVGLDVVKNKIESLGGIVTIDSNYGKGTIFSIQLPLTLTIISAMLIKLDVETYAIPISSIIESAVIRKEDIFDAHNQKVIDFRGKIVPLIFLKEIFEIEELENRDLLSIVYVRKGEKMAGLVVDSFIGQQEIVLKTLGNYLSSIPAISGATILGNGQVALIIDCNALIK